MLTPGYIKKRLRTRMSIIRAKHNSHGIINSKPDFEPVFIVSPGRSGTTILRKSLMSGREIHIPPESGECIPDAFESYVRIKRLPWPDRIRVVLETFSNFEDFKYWDIDPNENLDVLLHLSEDRQTFCAIVDHIYLLHAARKNPLAVRWGDKTPILSQSLDRLHACFPNAYYINLVRDPRDVIISMMNRLGYSMNAALDRWLTSYRCAARWSSGGKMKLLTLKYEDLVATPEATLKQVCRFTDLTFSPSMLGEHLDLDFGDTLLPHLASANQPLQRGGMPQSRHCLARTQLHHIERATKKERKRLGYA